jgi:hypothetical protein
MDALNSPPSDSTRPKVPYADTEYSSPADCRAHAQDCPLTRRHGHHPFRVILHPSQHRQPARLRNQRCRPCCVDARDPPSRTSWPPGSCCHSRFTDLSRRFGARSAAVTHGEPESASDREVPAVTRFIISSFSGEARSTWSGHTRKGLRCQSPGARPNVSIATRRDFDGCEQGNYHVR